MRDSYFASNVQAVRMALDARAGLDSAGVQAVLDADDHMAPDRIERLMKEAESNVAIKSAFVCDFMRGCYMDAGT